MKNEIVKGMDLEQRGIENGYVISLAIHSDHYRVRRTWFSETPNFPFISKRYYEMAAELEVREKNRALPQSDEVVELASPC